MFRVNLQVKPSNGRRFVEKPITKNVMFRADSNENTGLKATYVNIVKENNIIVSNDTRDIIGRQKPSILRKLRLANQLEPRKT